MHSLVWLFYVLFSFPSCSLSWKAKNSNQRLNLKMCLLKTQINSFLLGKFGKHVFVSIFEPKIALSLWLLWLSFNWYDEHDLNIISVRFRVHSAYRHTRTHTHTTHSRRHATYERLFQPSESSTRNQSFRQSSACVSTCVLCIVFNIFVFDFSVTCESMHT